MKHWNLLALDAAHRCHDALLAWQTNTYLSDSLVDRAIQMCDEINRHVDEWAPTRLHRWLGFIFGIMAARNIITFREQGALMRELMVPYPEHPDKELQDHNDPRSPFSLDIGGCG